MKIGFEFVNYARFATAALVFSPLFYACSTVEEKPNVIFVFADQWRASATGFIGNEDIKTPNIDKLAKESMDFRNAISVCPVCTPYRASLLTGRYPTSTGMFLNDLHLSPEEYTMAEIFKDAGYSTAYIGKWHLDGHGRRANIPRERRQGWEYWKAAECEHNNYQSHYYTGDSDIQQYWEEYDVIAQTEDARQYIRDQSKKDKPFILMLSYGPPHPLSPLAPEEYLSLYDPEKLSIPLNVPAEKEGEVRELLHNYYALCSIVDRCVGDLLKTIDEAGIAKNTVFVFTSDHGGMLWSHGLTPYWKQVSWAESAHVPFLLRYPEIHGSKGQILETPISTPDILPTLLGLAKIKVPSQIDGENLASLVEKGDGKKDRVALYMSVSPFDSQTDGIPYRAIRTTQYTYVRNLDGPWRLFDDVKDPFQLNNLVENDESGEIVKSLEKKLQAQLKKIGDDFNPPKWYIEEWGLSVDPVKGHIRFSDYGVKAQMPRRK
jgi:arylsulfatase A-like enzyme